MRLKIAISQFPVICDIGRNFGYIARRRQRAQYAAQGDERRWPARMT